MFGQLLSLLFNISCFKSSAKSFRSSNKTNRFELTKNLEKDSFLHILLTSVDIEKVSCKKYGNMQLNNFLEKKTELLWFLDHRLLDVSCGSQSSLQRLKKSKQFQQSCDYEEVEQSLTEDVQNVLSVEKLKLNVEIWEKIIKNLHFIDHACCWQSGQRISAAILATADNTIFYVLILILAS